MRKVSWPNRKELITYTIVVLATVVFVAVFTGVVDVIITAVLNLMSQLGG
ncbi:MAG: preprotein translocase subunit SecE [Limnochordia bacterium]|jgi:preprotein translocase subunit SecE